MQKETEGAKQKRRRRRRRRRGQDMVDPVEYIFSFCYFLARLFHLIRKAASMALCSNPAAHASPRPPPWKRLTDTSLNVPPKRAKEASDLKPHRVEDELVKPENLALGRQESTPKAEASNEERVSLSGPQDFNLKFDVSTHAEYENENLDLGRKEECGRPVVPAPELDSLLPRKVQEEKVALKTRKRPPRLVIPAESCANSDFNEASKMQNMVQKELEVEGSGYCVASRRGHRLVMEDGYEVITHIHGDSKQAFFGVFDGHGGRAAVDFVSEKLGKNIITALDKLEKGENQLELALRAGYLTTDKEFLSKGFSSGACAATVLLKDGELHAANVGDCRVVISQKGVAIALTSDHRAGREDERNRIERSGGYVSCRNGVWRVQDSLAVSRAIGDRNMKEWIISEPETRELRLTPDYEFLIVASDGLWDKVTNQEAVDVVLRHKNPMKSCKDLVDLSCNRGNRDDITVMVVDLQNFVQTGT